MPHTGHTYMGNSCFQKRFWFIIYSCNKESVALTAVGTSNIELRERLVPHHIKTAGCHGHEPNRLCLLSSTYKRQIRPFESGLRLLTWQIRGGFGGGYISNCVASIHQRPRTQPAVWGFNATFHFEVLCQGKFWYFRTQSVFCLWLEVSKTCFERTEKSACLLFGPRSTISHTVRRRATLCSDIREAASLCLPGFICLIWDCWREYGS